MNVSVERQGSVCVLTLDGELAGDVVQTFRDLARQALGDGCHDFVVDFSKASSVDSRGLEGLTWLKRECDEHLGMIKLCGLSPTLQKVFAITRLSRQFDQFDSPHEALATLA